jgi:tetratricopeptide (TPR) repeat protein
VIKDPKNANLHRSLSISQAKIREVQGKLDEARATAEEKLAISQRLVEQNPDNADLQRDLAVTYSRVGNALESQNKLDEAQEAFGESVSILARLIEQDPSNASLQATLTAVHNRVGKMLRGWLETSELGRLIGEIFGPTETTLKDMELIRPSVLEDIQHVAYQELLAYDAADAVPEYILTKWFKQNPTGFNMILYDGKKIKHLNLLPFKENFLAQFADGNVIEKD